MVDSHTLSWEHTAVRKMCCKCFTKPPGDMCRSEDIAIGSQVYAAGVIKPDACGLHLTNGLLHRFCASTLAELAISESEGIAALSLLIAVIDSAAATVVW